ncbi:hypothetical protein FB381_4673 [Nocardioides albertanoniae]|uniref:Excreted virulence factor EspC (Type VII ESX diderm) n=1 Tax=Nocardioides albertanoniae TaxID=1175486 RepID=A0A543ADS5_9ACTN|nr:flagellar protein FlgN [Nocardioides albertanoniae]TQL70731.1 hypothetical protein FB381_4673 [Nocardioides albertanoniae]
MGDKVHIKISELETMHASLESIVKEFEDATDRSEDLESDIGRPFGRGELQDAVKDFEERWDDQRGKLKESLEEIAKKTKAVVDGFNKFDDDAAGKMSNSGK